MTSLTLHAIDDTLADALRRHAAETGTSLNRSAKALLARALGVESPAARPDPSFMRFAGRLSPAGAAKLRAAVETAGFSRVDPADWA